MQIDLSVLENIRNNPQSSEKAPSNINVPQDVKAPVKPLNLGVERSGAERTFTAGELSDLSQEMRRQLLKGLARGDNPYKLLLKAIGCIGILTQDQVIHAQAKDQVQTVYGDVMGDPLAYDDELNDLTNRLIIMKGTYEAMEDKEKRKALFRSVRQIEMRIEEIEEAKGKAETKQLKL